MKFSSKTTFPSKVPGFEGVTYTVRLLNEPRRLEIRMATADANRRLREIRQRAMDTLGIETLDGETLSKFSPEQFAAFEPFREESSIIYDRDVVPAHLKTLLVSVNGLDDIDGEPPTLDNFWANGPEELQREIRIYISRQTGLTPREEGESAPPSISTGPEGGPTKITGANPAETAETT